MLKFTILLVRKPTLTHEEFVAHHKLAHSKLFMSVPAVAETVRRYVQQHRSDVNLPDMPMTRYDGITELWFDDLAGLARCFPIRNISSASVPMRPRSSICTLALSSF